MKVDTVLEKYSLTRDTAAQYIDAITRKNQTETAEALGVSRDTINRYKNAFSQMTGEERNLVIAALLQEKLLEESLDR